MIPYTATSKGKKPVYGCCIQAEGTHAAAFRKGMTHEIEAQRVHARKCRHPQWVLHRTRFAFEKAYIEMWLRVLRVCEIDNVRVVGKDLEMAWRCLAASYLVMRSSVYASDTRVRRCTMNRVT